MHVLRSFVAGDWHEASDGFATLHDPSTENPIARASSDGVDFSRALEYGRTVGGPALRGMGIRRRAEMLLELSKALHGIRDELIDLSVETTGTTRRDSKFDIDGAIFTLSHYGHLGLAQEDRPWLLEDEGQPLGRSSRFWGQHVFTPLTGCSVQINAFNFPAWGLAEKAACAWLAGVPVLSKPATSTSMVTERTAVALLDSGLLPEGALQLICGRTGDLLERLGTQDVLAFTGSAATALKLRGLQNLLESSTRVNVEADSLNAAVLAADVEPGSELWNLFVRDVVREITQKSGQKCTAVRRIFVPRERLDEVQQALGEALGDVVTGNPRDGSVTMGPLATEQQLNDAVEGTTTLAGEAEIVIGSGARVEGVGAEPGRGYYFAPTVLRRDDGEGAEQLHRREVFGPVSTLIGYDGAPATAARGVARGEGCLVSSIYTDETAFLDAFLTEAGSSCGRLYLGSTKVAGQMPGSGVAMPHLLHGGPGRAGGGQELGGLRGLELYLQRVALMGDRIQLQRLLAERKGSTATAG